MLGKEKEWEEKIESFNYLLITSFLRIINLTNTYIHIHSYTNEKKNTKQIYPLTDTYIYIHEHMYIF